MASNFRLLTEYNSLHVKDFVPGDGVAILDPLNARPLIDGEWLTINASYQAVRGGDNNAATIDEGTVKAFACHYYQGSYDVQTLGKVPLLFVGGFEAETLIMDDTGLTLGDALSVNDVAVGGIVYRGLMSLTAGYEVARCDRTPATNNNWLRFTTVNH